MGVCAFERLDAHYPGTGDLFASVLTGALLRGEGLEGAVRRATDFTRLCVRRSMRFSTPVNYGVDLEPLLPLVCGTRQQSARMTPAARKQACPASPVDRDNTVFAAFPRSDPWAARSRPLPPFLRKRLAVLRPWARLCLRQLVPAPRRGAFFIPLPSHFRARAPGHAPTHSTVMSSRRLPSARPPPRAAVPR